MFKIRKISKAWFNGSVVKLLDDEFNDLEKAIDFIHKNYKRTMSLAPYELNIDYRKDKILLKNIAVTYIISL